MPRTSTAAARPWLTLAVFAVAFLGRVLFWQATPDRDWPHSAMYKGDALVWTDYAAALGSGRSFELGLPLRPPGNGYLLSWLGVRGPGDASGAKLVWCLLGALAVTFVYRAALAAFGPAIALGVALWCSFSTSLLVLSTSLNNETPYLVLIGLVLWLTAKLDAKPRSGLLVLWGAVNALACLMRVEHLLFFALALAWLALRHRPPDWRRPGAWAAPLRPGVIALVAFVAVLAPWHLESWASIRAFNSEPTSHGPASDAAQSAIEQALTGIEWTAAAQAEREGLPAFARRSAGNFVAATVAWRGGREVDAADFGILEEAFGSRPVPLPERPFVALYGPLNFYLAQRSESPVGFDPDGLDRPARLAGGAGRYPTPLVAGLPPRELNFQYPPHLEIVTDGYRLGAAAILAAPSGAVRRGVARLGVLWQGASAGWTGHGLPWGIAGVRRAVDLAVPTGRAFTLWLWVLAAVCLGGVWLARRDPVLWVWLFFAAHKIVAGTAFFGYARHGATLVPVVALLVSIALVRAVEPRIAPATLRRLPAALLVVVALGLGLEVARWLAPPTLRLDGRPVVAADPHPLAEHLDRRLTIE